MLNSKKIVSKLIGASVAMAVFFCLTAQGGEKKANYKKLYETKTKEFEENLKVAKEVEHMDITDDVLKKRINDEAKEECNKEIAKQGGGLIITSKPINVIIDECVRQKTPEMWKKRNEIKENWKKKIKNEIAEFREMLTLEGCKKAAEKDKDCTDDLIVKFDRFGTCICEAY